MRRISSSIRSRSSGRDRLGELEVVVEAVGDRGPDRDLGVGPQVQHRLRHDVSRRVAKDGERRVVAVGQDADRLAVAHRQAQVPHLAVDLDGDGGVGQTGADRGRRVAPGRALVEGQLVAVGEENAHGRQHTNRVRAGTLAAMEPLAAVLAIALAAAGGRHRAPRPARGPRARGPRARAARHGAAVGALGGAGLARRGDGGRVDPGPALRRRGPGRAREPGRARGGPGAGRPRDAARPRRRRHAGSGRRAGPGRRAHRLHARAAPLPRPDPRVRERPGRGRGGRALRPVVRGRLPRRPPALLGRRLARAANAAPAHPGARRDAGAAARRRTSGWT